MMTGPARLDTQVGLNRLDDPAVQRPRRSAWCVRLGPETTTSSLGKNARALSSLRARRCASARARRSGHCSALGTPRNGLSRYAFCCSAIGGVARRGSVHRRGGETCSGVFWSQPAGRAGGQLLEVREGPFGRPGGGSLLKASDANTQGRSRGPERRDLRARAQLGRRCRSPVDATGERVARIGALEWARKRDMTSTTSSRANRRLSHAWCASSSVSYKVRPRCTRDCCANSE